MKSLSIQKSQKRTKINYPKSRIKNNFGYGIVMIAVGFFAVYINSTSVFSYLWILMGALQLGTSMYQKKHQYLTIDENKLIKHSLIPKTIELSEIKKVRKFVNSYKIETSDRTLRIEKNLIENDSLYRLNKILDNLNLS